MTHELPDGWVLVPLRDIANIVMGQSPPGSSYNKVGNGLPFFQGKADFGPRYPIARVWCSAPSRVAESEDVLMAVRAPVGPTNVADQKCAIGRGLAAIRPRAGIPSDWILHVLTLRRKELEERATGSTFTAIGREVVEDVETPVAPLAEQRRIVAKVKALLAEVNVARERLANVSALLKRFRQSVLAAACSSGEPISLGEILESVTYGTARKCLPNVSGTPVLRIPNIAKGLIDKDDLKFAKLDRQEREKFALSEGDLLMVRSNGSVSLVGRTALVSEADIGFAFAGYLLRLRFDRQRALPSYVSLALRTYEVRGQIEIPARSTSGVHNINAEEVRKLRIRLPSVKEQSDVVRRVETLFALADGIEQQVAGASGRADRLFQSILGKAFRGELVPTEAELAGKEGRDYEAASTLLERIREHVGKEPAESVATPARPRPRRSRGSVRRAHARQPARRSTR